MLNAKCASHVSIVQKSGSLIFSQVQQLTNVALLAAWGKAFVKYRISSINSHR